MDFAKQILAQVANFKNDDDKKLSLHLTSADFINARLKHSGDRSMRYEFRKWNGRDKPSIVLATDNETGAGTDGADFYVYAGYSPKIPPFLLGDKNVIRGWIYQTYYYDNALRWYKYSRVWGKVELRILAQWGEDNYNLWEAINAQEANPYPDSGG